MNKRDREKLQALLVSLTAYFSDPLKQSVVIFRGDARAIVAAIRELEKGQKK
jgi:hypothetical protein